jgi:hypothetical protein
MSKAIARVSSVPLNMIVAKEEAFVYKPILKKESNNADLMHEGHHHLRQSFGFSTTEFKKTPTIKTISFKDVSESEASIDSLSKTKESNFGGRFKQHDCHECDADSFNVEREAFEEVSQIIEVVINGF